MRSDAPPPRRCTDALVSLRIRTRPPPPLPHPHLGVSSHKTAFSVSKGLLCSQSPQGGGCGCLADGGRQEKMASGKREADELCMAGGDGMMVNIPGWL